MDVGFVDVKRLALVNFGEGGVGHLCAGVKEELAFDMVGRGHVAFLKEWFLYKLKTGFPQLC